MQKTGLFAAAVLFACLGCSKTDDHPFKKGDVVTIPKDCELMTDRAEFLDHLETGDRGFAYDMALYEADRMCCIYIHTEVKIIEPMKQGARVKVLAGRHRDAVGYLAMDSFKPKLPSEFPR
jgi:hypothetical protein